MHGQVSVSTYISGSLLVLMPLAYISTDSQDNLPPALLAFLAFCLGDFKQSVPSASMGSSNSGSYRGFCSYLGQNPP